MHLYLTYICTGRHIFLHLKLADPVNVSISFYFELFKLADAIANILLLFVFFSLTIFQVNWVC
jgi:hypothetical protein